MDDQRATSSGLRGVWVILPTPFTHNHAVDVASIRTLVDMVVGLGVDGITVLGVLGEGSRLADDERSSVVESTVAAAAGRLPVCVGITHAATAVVTRNARDVETRGAHSVMVAPPTLAKPNDDVVRGHFLDVSAASRLPVVVQDHPPSSGVRMDVELLARLAEEAPNCSTVKLEDEPTPPKIARLRAASPGASILGGMGGLMVLEDLHAGADGMMTGFAFPEILVSIVTDVCEGRDDGAAATFDRYASLFRFETQAFVNLAIRKTVYQRRGAITTAEVRRPGAPLDAVTATELERVLTRLDLADAGADAVTDGTRR